MARAKDAPDEPAWGWNGGRRLAQAFMNPRAPAVPATLDLELEDYYTGCALIGVISSQLREPNQDWITKWAADQGEKVAAEVRARRRRRTKERT